jgi:hypothetical protein
MRVSMITIYANEFGIEMLSKLMGYKKVNMASGY